MIAALSVAAYYFVYSVNQDLLEPILTTPEGERTLHDVATQSIRLIASIDIPLLCIVAGSSYALARISLQPMADLRAREQQFVADAAHELRTPLAAIAGAAQAAEPADAASQAAFENIASIALDASNMMSDLLLLLRRPEIDTRSQEPLDLGAFVAAISEAYGQRNLRPINTTFTPGVFILGDANRLQRLVTNLLENALRHARNSVDVHIFSRDGNAEILVADDGDGVAPADAERVFERFFTSGRAGESHGLGLPICRWIARAHRGEITVDGACFRVQIPLTGT